jgi:hypothetical protein
MTQIHEDPHYGSEGKQRAKPNDTAPSPPNDQQARRHRDQGDAGDGDRVAALQECPDSEAVVIRRQGQRMPNVGIVQWAVAEDDVNAADVIPTANEERREEH